MEKSEKLCVVRHTCIESSYGGYRYRLRNSHIAPEMCREWHSYIHERNVVQNKKSETLTRIQRIEILKTA
jgi:hypothetical protein